MCINKAKAEDEAKYTIKIQNEIGEERATASVFVRCNKQKQNIYKGYLRKWLYYIYFFFIII